jgi:hypothetical protein
MQPAGIQIDRLDLCLYAPVPPKRILSLFERRRRDGFQRTPTRYAGGLAWKGAEKVLQMYDKLAELREGHDSQTRVELQLLKPRQIASQFGLPEGMQLNGIPSIQWLYHWFRAYLIQGFGQLAVASKYNQDSLIAFGIENGWRAPDGTALELWRTAALSEVSAKRTMRKIQEIRLTYSRFDWAAAFPEYPSEEQWRDMTIPGMKEEQLPQQPYLPQSPMSLSTPLVPALNEAKD